jgi:hypothetical protein
MNLEIFKVKTTFYSKPKKGIEKCPRKRKLTNEKDKYIPIFRNDVFC